MATVSFYVLVIACALVVLACLGMLALALLPSGRRDRRPDRGA